MLPFSVVGPVTDRLDRDLLPPTAAPNVTAPVPAFAVRLCAPAVAPFTVLVKSIAPLTALLSNVVWLPSVPAPKLVAWPSVSTPFVVTAGNTNGEPPPEIV